MTDAKEKSVWRPILPVPEDALPKPSRHPAKERGEPLEVFPYINQQNELLGYVCRFMNSTGQPVHLPLTWCEDQHGARAWRWIQFQRMRPLYGMDQVSWTNCPEEGTPGHATFDPEMDEDWIIVCFDEHAVRAARVLFPQLRPVTWPGGISKIDEADWSLLKHRNVWIWPTKTADRKKLRRDQAGDGDLLPRAWQSGWKAALKIERHLISHGCSVMAIADPYGDDSLPEGFDAGMAGTFEWSPERTQEWFVTHSVNSSGDDIQRLWRRLKGERDPTADETVPNAGRATAEVTGKAGWKYRLLETKQGVPVNCLSNVYDILDNDADWRGVIAYDLFAQRVVKLKPPPWEGGTVGEWDSTDDSQTAMWLSRLYYMTPPSVMVMEAVEVLARANAFHPVRDWLRSLKWDQTPRLDFWLEECLGASRNEYTILAGRWWVMGAVGRVMSPGSKFDYCLVLEGPQGKGKSTAFRIMGGDWYGDTDMDLSNKDSMSALRGKLVYEFSELGAITKAEETRQKSFLSRMVDEYRPVYGRREIRAPRQVVFGGTTNGWEWNKDPTGGRRFWPIDCGGEFRLDVLAAWRDQLFAEAFHRYQAGERYHPTADEQRVLFDPEQLKREQQDAIVDPIHKWVHETTMREFSVSTVAIEALKITDMTKLTRDLQTRIGICLRKLGCSRFEKRTDKTARYWYKPPENVATSSDPSSNLPGIKPAGENGGGDG